MTRMNIIRFNIRSEEGRSQPKTGSGVYGDIAPFAGISSDDECNNYDGFIHSRGLSFCERNQHLYHDLLCGNKLVPTFGGVIMDLTLAINTMVLPLIERTKKLGYS